ncbi:AcrR family transcriptional regulator [Kibdelosporangium banguiense]|uniref:AcrR family transcriptional regulator n=1 Tax=Kibdelosporangium banguiense TaxID=1365924 RepID=A0ABS4TNQ3_9PSEU|nr:TetR/AcrR family transcriptional regulator [Kibdelosporangium banguiense]MBP2326009.1 AcrR family transcriptional regulator [Kibdelosporangium banguiense]
MSTERYLRADAARNAERILRAAREVFAEQGPDAQLEEIARHAGVGIRTLYRRFPHKEELVRAALEQGIAEDLSSAIDRALEDDDPLRALTALMEATLAMIARERNTLAAASNSGALTTEVTAPLLDSLTLVTKRAQQAGLVRADLTPEDMHRIMGMLTGVLWGMDRHSDGWRRYVVLILDALSPNGASALPHLEPIQRAPKNGKCWPNPD